MIRSSLKMIHKFLTDDLAIDLGTANTRLYSLRVGLVAEKPSFLPVAHPIVGTSPKRHDFNNFSAHSPLLKGVISDKDAAVTLLAPLIKKGKRHTLIRPRVLACAPTDSSEQERHTLNLVLRKAGASDVMIVPEPFAAAIGSDAILGSQHAGMFVDIGAGTTDMAVIREGRILKSATIRIGCHDMQQAIRDMARKRYHFLPDQIETERLTRDFCVPTHLNLHTPPCVSGLSLDDGKSIAVNINPYDIIVAIQPVFTEILDAIEKAMQQMHDNLICEVIESGIALSGGGACIKNIDKAIESRTNITVKTVADPLHAVIRGAERIIHTMNIADLTWETITWPISPAICLPLE